MKINIFTLFLLLMTEDNKNSLIYLEKDYAIEFLKERLTKSHYRTINLNFNTVKIEDLRKFKAGSIPKSGHEKAFGVPEEKVLNNSKILGSLAVSSICHSKFVESLSYDDDMLLDYIRINEYKHDLLGDNRSRADPIVALFNDGGRCLYLARERQYKENIRLPNITSVFLLINHFKANFVRFYRFIDTKENELTREEAEYLNNIRRFLRKCDVNLDSLISITDSSSFIRYQFNVELKAKENILKENVFAKDRLNENFEFRGQNNEYFSLIDCIPKTPYVYMRDYEDILKVKEVDKDSDNDSEATSTEAKENQEIELNLYCLLYLASQYSIRGLEKFNSIQESFNTFTVVKNPIELLRVVRPRLTEKIVYLIGLNSKGELIEIIPWIENNPILSKEMIISLFFEKVSSLIVRRVHKLVYLEFVDNPYSDTFTQEKIINLIRGLSYDFNLLGLPIIDVILIAKDFVSANTDWIYSSVAEGVNLSSNDPNFDFSNYYIK